MIIFSITLQDKTRLGVIAESGTSGFANGSVIVHNGEYVNETLITGVLTSKGFKTWDSICKLAITANDVFTSLLVNANGRPVAKLVGKDSNGSTRPYLSPITNLDAVGAV